MPDWTLCKDGRGRGLRRRTPACQEPNAHREPVRCTRGALRYRARRRSDAGHRAPERRRYSAARRHQSASLPTDNMCYPGERCSAGTREIDEEAITESGHHVLGAWFSTVAIKPTHDWRKQRETNDERREQAFPSEIRRFHDHFRIRNQLPGEDAEAK